MHTSTRTTLNRTTITLSASTPSTLSRSSIERIESELKERFASYPAATGAALSELQSCIDFPQYLAGVIKDMRNSQPDTVEMMIIRWASIRGSFWQ